MSRVKRFFICEGIALLIGGAVWLIIPSVVDIEPNARIIVAVVVAFIVNLIVSKILKKKDVEQED